MYANRQVLRHNLTNRKESFGFPTRLKADVPAE